MAISNLEAIARAECERVWRRAGDDGTDMQAWIDRHWHSVAAEIEAGLLDEAGNHTSDWTLERGLAALRDYRRRHP